MRSPFVAQAFVYGDSLQAHLVAIIVPDPDTLLPWAAARGLPQDMTRLVTDPTVTTAVFNSILEEGRTSKLRGFEQVCCALACAEDVRCAHSSALFSRGCQYFGRKNPPIYFLCFLLTSVLVELCWSFTSSSLV